MICGWPITDLIVHFARTHKICCKESQGLLVGWQLCRVDRKDEALEDGEKDWVRQYERGRERERLGGRKRLGESDGRRLERKRALVDPFLTLDTMPPWPISDKTIHLI